MRGPGAISGQLVMPIMADYTDENITTDWSDRSEAYVICYYTPSSKTLAFKYRYATDSFYGIRLDVYAK